jgi:competence ComEA-like helix-hairpin-helix protein
LADAAIQLDIAQIRDATAGLAHASDGSLNSNSPVCWASQPGAIRTYDTNASNVSVYKLYSATNMVATNASYNSSNDLPSSGWSSNTAQWVDLNSFVVSGTNTNYPIMDPFMTNLVAGVGFSGGGVSVGSGSPIVDGFTIGTNPSLTGVSNTAAMPVSWIYVLKNGTLTTPSSVSGNTATFTVNAPTQSNPIVGRIAFWTDDESCKLNLNTASEAELESLPGIGAKLADRIIQERQQKAFSSLEDLKRVAGIKDSKLEKLRGKVSW